MKTNKGYFKKGFYNHPQVKGFPSVKQFILLEKEGKRCLLLRFVNGTDLKIDRMQIVLTQLDISGKVINKSKVQYRDMRFAPETTYVSSKGIIVKNECVDFRVDITYVVVGEYKYVKSNGCIVDTYDTRGYKESSSKVNGVVGAKIKGARINSALYRFAAFISLVLVVLSCCFVFFVKVDDLKIKKETDYKIITEIDMTEV